MTEPIPVYYHSPSPQMQANLGYLKTLSICHYVYGGLVMFFSCFGFIYIVLGIVIASGNPAMKSAFAPTTSSSGAAGPSPEAFGYIFAGVGGCIVLFGWTMGLLAIWSGRKIAKRKSRMFSIVMAGIDCLSFPLGTTLGVFTIIVLTKESVKQIYDEGL